jgi:hypothetical protein
MTVVINQGNKVIEVSLDAGDTTQPIFTQNRGDVVVAATPSGGGTVNVQATWSNETDIFNGTARWFDWDAGATATAANQLLLKATAVRFIAAVGSAVGEVAL